MPTQEIKQHTAKQLEGLDDDALEKYALQLGEDARKLREHRVEVRAEIDRRAAEVRARELAEGMDPAVLAALQSIEPTPVESSAHGGDPEA